MDEQRKRVYGYRQRILDGGNCKQLILDMIDKQIQQRCPICSNRPTAGKRSRAGPRTRWGSRSTPARSTGWTGSGSRITSVDEAGRQAEDDIAEKIEEDLPEKPKTSRNGTGSPSRNGSTSAMVSTRTIAS